MASPLTTTDSLPLYAAPFDPARPARVQFTSRPHRPGVRLYGAQTVARDIPWLDAIERWILAYNRWHGAIAVPVTRANSTIACRMHRPASEVDQALNALASCSELRVGSTRLTFLGFDATGQLQARARLPWSRPSLAVAISARAWSSSRCDLVLELDRTRRLRFPRRWFRVGHDIVDELRRRAAYDLGAGGR